MRCEDPADTTVRAELRHRLKCQAISLLPFDREIDWDGQVRSKSGLRLRVPSQSYETQSSTTDDLKKKMSKVLKLLTRRRIFL